MNSPCCLIWIAHCHSPSALLGYYSLQHFSKSSWGVCDQFSTTSLHLQPRPRVMWCCSSSWVSARNFPANKTVKNGQTGKDFDCTLCSLCQSNPGLMAALILLCISFASLSSSAGCSHPWRLIFWAHISKVYLQNYLERAGTGVPFVLKRIGHPSCFWGLAKLRTAHINTLVIITLFTWLCAIHNTQRNQASNSSSFLTCKQNLPRGFFLHWIQQSHPGIRAGAGRHQWQWHRQTRSPKYTGTKAQGFAWFLISCALIF